MTWQAARILVMCERSHDFHVLVDSLPVAYYVPFIYIYEGYNELKQTGPRTSVNYKREERDLLL
jgi:hypothetical protein